MTTLLDYVNSRENVVLFLISIGTPEGWREIICPDFNNTISLELTGTVEENGTWEWNGDGHPTDMNRNSIVRIQAYENQEEYQEIYQEIYS